MSVRRSVAGARKGRKCISKQKSRASRPRPRKSQSLPSAVTTAASAVSISVSSTIAPVTAIAARASVATGRRRRDYHRSWTSSEVWSKRIARRVWVGDNGSKMSV